MRKLAGAVALVAALGCLGTSCGGSSEPSADAASDIDGDTTMIDGSMVDIDGSTMIDGATCHTCSDILAGMGAPPLCPGSEALFTALNDCTCGGACMADCAANVCAGMAPTSACTMCIENMDSGCGAQFAACAADGAP